MAPRRFELRHSADSANIAYYRERKATKGEPYIWVEALRSWLPGEIGRPYFAVTVYRTGAGELGSFIYKPERRPRPGRLPAPTVTRLVREWLQGRGEL